MNCELGDLGWINVETHGDNNHVVHWNKTAIREDIMSFTPNHEVAQFFMAVDPATIENWMENCESKTVIILMKKLLMKKYCADVYTDEQRMELQDIMEKYGSIIAENMCIRTLFGVGCECNDFQGKPVIEIE